MVFTFEFQYPCFSLSSMFWAALQKIEQDGRLAPAYFSPENKNFDQHMQTVKNEATV